MQRRRSAAHRPTLSVLALSGCLAACAGRAIEPNPEPDPPVGGEAPEAAAADVLVRPGRIDWEGDLEVEEALEEGEVAGESVIAVGGGAGGSMGARYGGRARAGPATPAPGASGGGSGGGPTPPSPASLAPAETAALRSLGYNGEVFDSALLADDSASHGGDDFFLGQGQAAARVGVENGAVEPTWQRATAAPNTSRLMVGEGDALALEGASTEVWVEGFRARVVLDLLYRNDREQRLEGTFQLRLPDGATPYYLAFGAETWESAPPTDGWMPRRSADERRASGSSPDDIARAREPFWAGVKEARMVPRDRGAQAYEQTVARQVDPALLEWAGAGVFRTKVFPLMPGELHRVVLGYEVDLLRTDADAFELALGLADVTPHPVDVQLALPAGASAVLTLGDSVTRVGGERGANRHVPLDGSAGSVLGLRVDGLRAPLLTAPRAAGRGLFATTVQPALDAGAATASERAVILLDTSRSAADDYPTWLALLDALLASDVAPAEFALLGYDVGQSWLTDGFVRNTEAARRAARAAAEAQWLAGATDLSGALAEAAAPAWWRGRADWDLFLLGDGASTWGEADAARIAATLDRAPDSALFAYRTGRAGADTALLVRLARASGGAVFTVADSAAVAAAARAHAGAPWSLEAVRVDGGDDLLVDGRPRFLFPGQALTVVGRGAPSTGARLTLELERAGVRETWGVTLDQDVVGELAERAFGRIAVAQLEELDPAARRDAEDLALHFRVPGTACSLLMLESDEEYAAYGLEQRDTSAAAASLGVAARVASLWAEAGAALADPRARLAGFLGRIAALPNVGFEGADELVAALGALPPSALTVVPEPLATTRRAAAVDASLLAAASAEELEEAPLRDAVDALGTELASADRLRALSTLAETHAGDPAAARELGFDALGLGFPGHAYHQLLRAAEARPFEPSTYLALAEAAAAADKLELAWIWFEVALGGEWDARFGDFRHIASVSCLHWLRANATDLAPTVAERLRERAGSLARDAGFLAADVVVFVQWSTDRTDVDLHVLEPNGEHCYYGHRETAQGGRMSRDVTQGLGPELFFLPEAEAGDYGLGVRYYASDRNKTALRTRVHATVYRHFGQPDERMERHVLTLGDAGGMADIGILAVD